MRKRVLVVAGSALLVAGLALLLGLELGGKPALPERRAYYTIDDGVTCFAAETRVLPPFDHEGHAAVRAHVYDWGDGSPREVLFLQRYTANGLARFSSVPASQRPPTDVLIFGAEHDLVEVKRPGESTWITIADRRAAAMIHPPRRGTVVPREVWP